MGIGGADVFAPFDLGANNVIYNRTNGATVLSQASAACPPANTVTTVLSQGTAVCSPASNVTSAPTTTATATTNASPGDSSVVVVGASVGVPLGVLALAVTVAFCIRNRRITAELATVRREFASFQATGMPQFTSDDGPHKMEASQPPAEVHGQPLARELEGSRP